MSQRKASKLYALSMFLVVSVLCGLLTAGLAIPVVAMGGGMTKAGADSLTQLPAELTIPAQPEGSTIYMADGTVLAEFYEQNRAYVPLAKISKNMQMAQLAIEDHRFYEHGAIDPTGTIRAVLRNSAGGNTQGGSTLTQQYVKQVLVLTAQLNNDQEGVQAATEESYARKFRELRYAISVEKELSKTEILERYLNIAYYGDGAYGVEAAAQHYFKTSAAKLTVAQSAMLAGLVQNPNATNPRLFPEAAVNRRNVVLNRMAEIGSIPSAPNLQGMTLSVADAEKAKKVAFSNKGMAAQPNGCTYSPFPHICDYVVKTLESDAMPSLGKTAEERANALRRGGLQIRTLIDPKTQKAAEAAIAKMVGPTDPLIATSVLIQPKTGLIVAMAQSRPKQGTKAGQTFYNYNVEASMGGGQGFQAGSTFKTFTAAAAIEKGMTPNTRIMAPHSANYKGQTFTNCDGPFTVPGDYKVTNSAGGDGRAITMVEGAKSSVNTYFIPLEQKAGLCNVTKMADKVGVKLSNGELMSETMDSFPSFTLGVADVSPLSMAVGYATFANRGVRCDPLILQKVTNKAGKAFQIPQNKCTQVVNKEVADGVNYVMKQVMESGGTGVRARIPDFVNQAGKTGTTESNVAVWFAGYTPEMAGIAMIAVDNGADKYWKDRGRKSLKGYTVPSTGVYLQGSGGGDAGQIYKAAMAAALQGKPDTKFVAPTEAIMTGKRVQVPSTRGMSFNEAKAALEAAGFSTATAREYSNFAPGAYLGFTYPSGSQPLGTTIYLAVSGGPRPAPRKVEPAPKPTTAPKPTATAAPKPTATTAPKPPPATVAPPKPTATKPGNR